MLIQESSNLTWYLKMGKLQKVMQIFLLTHLILINQMLYKAI